MLADDSNVEILKKQFSKLRADEYLERNKLIEVRQFQILYGHPTDLHKAANQELIGYNEKLSREKDTLSMECKDLYSKLTTALQGQRNLQRQLKASEDRSQVGQRASEKIVPADRSQ